MGNDLYPQLAMAIAKDHFSEVDTDHTIQGALNDAACNMIEQIVTELREPGRGRERRRPNRSAELDDIFNSRGGGINRDQLLLICM
jgi:hypothetical protein